jgi:hypothetical protein
MPNEEGRKRVTTNLTNLTNGKDAGRFLNSGRLVAHRSLFVRVARFVVTRPACCAMRRSGPCRFAGRSSTTHTLTNRVASGECRGTEGNDDSAVATGSARASVLRQGGGSCDNEARIQLMQTQLEKRLGEIQAVGEASKRSQSAAGPIPASPGGGPGRVPTGRPGAPGVRSALAGARVPGRGPGDPSP